jgi:hypothetical protein
MNIHCSVGVCPSLALWHFGEIGLCQRHWEDWCRDTWEALVDNVDQPIMADWLVTVKLWETVAR